MALPKERRLRLAADISRVYTKGSRGNGGSLFVRVLRSSRIDSRAVVVVGKKVSKKAVTRNKIRRQLTEAIVALWKDLATGQDIVVYVREDLSQKPAEGATALKKALVQAGALAKE